MADCSCASWGRWRSLPTSAGPPSAAGVSGRQRLILAVLLAARGRVVSADRLAEAVAAEALGQDYHRALAGVSRALAHMYRGDADAAVGAAAQARQAAEASGNHTARAWALYSSGEALLDDQPGEAAALLEQAIDAARQVDGSLIQGVALVSLASLRGRGGGTGWALQPFRDTVAHWRRLGDYTHQLTTLRNLVELLARAGAHEPAAVLHGAVTAGSTPSFGVEAERLADAWARLEQGLGTQAAHAAPGRGRRLSPDELVDSAIAP